MALPDEVVTEVADNLLERSLVISTLHLENRSSHSWCMWKSVSRKLEADDNKYSMMRPQMATVYVWRLRANQRLIGVWVCSGEGAVHSLYKLSY